MKSFTLPWFHKNSLNQILLTLLVISLPLERIPSIDFGGITIRLSLIIGGLLILRAIYLIIKGELALKISLVEGLLLSFGAWIVLLVPFALNHARAAEVTVFDLFVIILALSIKLLFKREYLIGITKALIYTTLGVCLFGLYQYFGNIFGLGSDATGLRERYSWEIFGFPRIQGASLEPLYFASLLTLPIAVISGLILTYGWRKLYAVTLALASLDLFLTVSRGGTFAYAFMLLLIAIYSIIRKKYMRGLAIFALVIFTYAIALLMIAKLNKPISFGPSHSGTSISTYAKQISDTGLSGGGDERAHGRTIALNIAKQHPIFGVGPGNFGPVVQGNIKPSSGWVIVNNETLELLAETGIVGLSLIIGAFTVMLILALRFVKLSSDLLSTSWVIGLCGFLVASAIQYQTFSTLYITHIWVGVGLLLAFLHPVLAEKASKAKADQA